MRSVFFFLFFTSQLKRSVVFLPYFLDRVCLNFPEQYATWKTAAIRRRGLSVFRQHVAHTYLAFSNKLFQFFLTPDTLLCATITASVEVSFFSLFSSPDWMQSVFVRMRLPAGVFLPLFSLNGKRQRVRKKPQHLSCCGFFFCPPRKIFTRLKIFNIDLLCCHHTPLILNDSGNC